MQYELLIHITNGFLTSLQGKYGPLYAGVLSITTLTLGYLLIDSKYVISGKDKIIQPQNVGKENTK